MTILILILVFLLAAILVVPLTHRLRLGSVLGYLMAGILLGPVGLRLIWDAETVLHFAEFGVIFLMFIIGLELKLSRLWLMRKLIFGLGSLQMLLTSIAIFAVGIFFNVNWQASLIIGLALSISSTALVLQSLGERKEINTQLGRETFAVLLFQDIAVVPIFALIPALKVTSSNIPYTLWDILIPIIVIMMIIFSSRIVIKPLFRWVGKIHSKELFTATALFVVLGTAYLTASIGLSMALGSFLAGVLFADTEFKHELEAEIEPFKGLFLGLFFMAIGMNAKVNILWERPYEAIAGVIGLLCIKAFVLFSIRYFAGQKKDMAHSRRLAIFLSQGGEFAFILMGLAGAEEIISQDLTDFVIITVSLSMLFSPLVFLIDDYLVAKAKPKPIPVNFKPGEEPDVVVIGFGRFGQIVGRVFHSRKIPYTAIDKNLPQVELMRKFGNRAYHGDATQVQVLKAAGCAKAKVIIVAVDDIKDSLLICDLLNKEFPDLKIFARAKNRFHAYQLIEHNIHLFVRETLHSSLELTRKALLSLGFDEENAKLIIATFKQYDNNLLLRQKDIYQDKEKMEQSDRDSLRELEELFTQDDKAPSKT